MSEKERAKRLTEFNDALEKIFGKRTRLRDIDEAAVRLVEMERDLEYVTKKSGRRVDSVDELASLEHTSIALNHYGRPFVLTWEIYDQGTEFRWSPVGDSTYSYTSPKAFLEHEGPVTVIYEPNEE